MSAREGIVAAVIESSTPMVVVEIPSGSIVAGNAGAAILVATTPEALQGRSSLSFISTELRPAAEVSLGLLAKGIIEGYHATRSLVRSDGSTLTVNGWTRRISDGLAVTALITRPAEAGDDAADDDAAGERAARELRRITSDLRAAGLVDALDRRPEARPDLQSDSHTNRQWDVLRRVLAGDRVATIANDLYISQSTVRSHLAAIFDIFDVHSQAELLALLR